MTTPTTVYVRRYEGFAAFSFVLFAIAVVLLLFGTLKLDVGFHLEDQYHLAVVGNQDVRIGADNADIIAANYINIVGVIYITTGVFDCEDEVDCGIWVTYPGDSPVQRYMAGSQDERR